MIKRALYRYGKTYLFFRYQLSDGTNVFFKAERKGFFRKHYEPNYNETFEIKWGNIVEYVGMVWTKTEYK